MDRFTAIVVFHLTQPPSDDHVISLWNTHCVFYVLSLTFMPFLLPVNAARICAFLLIILFFVSYYVLHICNITHAITK